MLEKLSTQKNQQFKYFTLLAVFYVTILLLTMVIENRIVLLGSIKILSGTLVIPLSYAVSDVITEIYGYRQMRRLIWISIIMLYIAAIIIHIIMSLPTDYTIKQDTAYSAVFSSFLRDILTYSIAALVSIFFNAYILSKWKILTAGKLFWLRSLGATAIGEAIFILTWGFLGFSDKFALKTLLGLMAVSYLCKIVYNLVAIIPTALLVAFLKKSEYSDVNDKNINFTPFSWKV